MTPVADGIDRTIEAADRYADLMGAVNSSTCLSPTAFNPGKRTASDQLALDYLRIGIFRHVREGFAPACYNQTRYDQYWSVVVARDGVRRIGGIGTGYTAEQIASLRKSAPGLEALEFANEWDEEKVPSDGSLKIARDAASGMTTLDVGGMNAWYWTVPGQSYVLGDGQDAETITLSSALPTSLSSVRLESPTHEAHPAGSSLRRVGDYVSDAALWYRNYVPALHAMQPGLAILAPSMAHPIDDSSFIGAPVGKFVDGLDSHPYPVGGYNPEGPDGDGIRGWILGDQGICSKDHTSFSFVFNVDCEGALQAGLPPERLSTWITEFAYETVPVGALHSTFWPTAVPDDVGVDYLAGTEFFASKHNVAHLFWFQLQDGTSGPSSPFCTYGLIRNKDCSDAYGLTPEAKPELLALLALTSYFSDRNCRNPACDRGPHAFSGNWMPSSLPLNTVNAKFSDGRVAIVFWLGVRSYDGTSDGPCSARTGCYIRITPRKERFSSQLIAQAHHVFLSGIDDNPSDPSPSLQEITPADGLGNVKIKKCPEAPTNRPEFGCVLPYVALRRDGDSVTVNATRQLQWILVEKR